MSKHFTLEFPTAILYIRIFKVVSHFTETVLTAVRHDNAVDTHFYFVCIKQFCLCKMKNKKVETVGAVTTVNRQKTLAAVTKNMLH